MADLVSTVWVTSEDGFTPVSFSPGDDVPAWAKEQMGDHCFVKADDDTPSKTPAKKAASSKTEK